jgi:hypothetical protein
MNETMNTLIVTMKKKQNLSRGFTKNQRVASGNDTKLSNYPASKIQLTMNKLVVIMKKKQNRLSQMFG